MLIDSEKFEAGISKLAERLDKIERLLKNNEPVRHKINGEMLLDNQDLCLMLNVSKRTLQRFRSNKQLPCRRINQKTYYLESDVERFIENNLKS
ncbi:MAG: helix-turn-helix domain-containing protein [Prevotellaceae bacterium]|jgi:hypothetical protein|nr:helix-turn-helix domain-containing protein [Prevotellaceae bacterium]